MRRFFRQQLFKFLPDTEQQKFDQQGDQVTGHTAYGSQDGGSDHFIAVELRKDDERHTAESADTL